MTASNSLGTGEPSAPGFARTQGAGKYKISKTTYIRKHHMIF